MFSSLRSRLLLSYVVIIGLTLCVAGGALFLLLLNSPVLALQVYTELDEIARRNLPALKDGSSDLPTRLTTIAEEENVRILYVNADRRVIFDSAGELVGRRLPDVQHLPDRFQPPDKAPVRGRIRDENGNVWFIVLYQPPPSAAFEKGQIIFAVSRNQFFGGFRYYLTPLAQAGLVGLLVSMLLAVLVSKSVVSPLKQLGQAAHAIAEGNYEHRVTQAGPGEVKELGQAFNQMAERVQQSQQTQSDFLANVSHDLKTPLTSIQGFAQAILDGMATDPTAAARIIHNEAGRMQRMVEDLLDLARIEASQTAMRRERVKLDDLLGGICQNLSLRAKQENITLLYTINPIPPLTGDNDRLSQVFINLLDNALTHTPAGGTVTLTAQSRNNGVEISVSDTGKGILPEDLSRIFERFYQADKSRSRVNSKGTGLGLTISKEIVENHGGTIHVESEWGQGATFNVWLPLPRPSDETVARKDY